MLTLGDLAAKIGGKLLPAGCEALTVDGIAPLASAGPRQVSFLTNPSFRQLLATTQAAAVIVPTADENASMPQIVHPNPQVAVAKVGSLFFKADHRCTEQSELAVVAASAKIAPTAILYPFCYIDDDAEIGPDVVIYPHAYIGVGSRIGAATVVFPGAVLMARTEVGERCIIHSAAVLGADGFGFAIDRAGLHKIPQTGNVKLGNDVEIGPGSTVDRAAYETTRLGDGCKLDSQVHVGHNVQVGAMTMLCAQVGIAGSTTIGKRVIMAGQAGAAQGVSIPDGTVVGSRGGVTKSLDGPGEYHGMPAVPAGAWRRQAVGITRLPELLKHVSSLEKRVAELERRHERSQQDGRVEAGGKENG